VTISLILLAELTGVDLFSVIEHKIFEREKTKGEMVHHSRDADRIVGLNSVRDENLSCGGIVKPENGHQIEDLRRKLVAPNAFGIQYLKR
jgi:hypothetical protein